MMDRENQTFAFPPSSRSEPDGFDDILMTAYRHLLALREIPLDLEREEVIDVRDNLWAALEHLRFARWGAAGKFPNGIAPDHKMKHARKHP